MTKKKTNVLIIGSAPSALAVQEWNLNLFYRIIVINNAWKIIPDWTNSIFPDDFPIDKRPKPTKYQSVHTASEYVRAQNHYGGFVYAGGTMAFTAAYWSLFTFSPSLIAYLGCDMIYSGTKTHFYGKGTADPLRKDKTLKNLKAKSARFECIASQEECAVVNLSIMPNSNLVHRRVSFSTLNSTRIMPRKIDEKQYARNLEMEKYLDYYVPDGKYWKRMQDFQEDEILKLDALWLKALDQS